MTTRISLELLPCEVRQALDLLKKRAEKAAKGIGKPDGKECPIAIAYGIFANEFWTDLPTENRKMLTRLGLKEEIYEEFIRWHDDNVAEKESPERVFLTEFLAAA